MPVRQWIADLTNINVSTGEGGPAGMLCHRVLDDGLPVEGLFVDVGQFGNPSSPRL